MRSRILVGLMAGAIGGLLGWIIQEHLVNYNALVVMKDGVCQEIANVVGPDQASAIAKTSQAALISRLWVCGCIGILLGAVDGIVDQNPRKLLLGMAIGFMGSIVVGSLGNNLGGQAYDVLGGHHRVLDHPSVIDYTLQIVARVFQLGLWGLGIGTGVALSTLNPKRILYGAIGGLLGGMITGFIFDLVSARDESGRLRSLNRPVQRRRRARPRDQLCGNWRLTGLFIGLVEELFKQAWVKVLAGRNEGKDFILYKAMNLLGRDERCDVPLFGDTSVAVQHAAIRADGRRHFLLAADTPAGTLVNGQKVQPNSEQMLRDGDMIQIGSHRILFHEKATASRLTRPNPDDMAVKKSGPGAVPIPSHLCSFCGAPKDAAGNCRCSLGAGGMAGAGAYPPLGGQPQGGYSPDFAATTALAAGFGGPMSMGPAIGQIVGVEGPYAGQVFSVQGVNMEVGREPGKDIALSADTTISRGHARLVHENGGLIVVDLGSSNGTYVNGQRLTAPMEVVPGDIVQFGSSKFRYE